MLKAQAQLQRNIHVQIYQCLYEYVVYKIHTNNSYLFAALFLNSFYIAVNYLVGYIIKVIKIDSTKSDQLSHAYEHLLAKDFQRFHGCMHGLVVNLS